MGVAGAAFGGAGLRMVPGSGGSVTQTGIFREGGRGGSEGAEAVGGAQDAGGAAVQHVGVDHGGGHVAVSEQLLDGADVGAVFQQVGGVPPPSPRAGARIRAGGGGGAGRSRGARRCGWLGRSTTRSTRGRRADTCGRAPRAAPPSPRPPGGRPRAARGSPQGAWGGRGAPRRAASSPGPCRPCPSAP